MADLILSKDLIQGLLNSAEFFPINFDDAWQWLGYSNCDNALRKLKKHFFAGTDFNFIQVDEVQNEGGRRVSRKINKYSLTIDCFKQLGMLAGTEKGKEVRKYFLECEQSLKELTRPKTALELAKEQVKLLEAIEIKDRMIALLQEDNERQAEAIDELFEYSSIIRIAKFNGCAETKFSWHQLKAASQALGVEIKKVPCPRFVTKNLYSHDAWRLAYPDYKLPETTTITIG
jgi:phage anti-repressor protein